MIFNIQLLILFGFTIRIMEENMALAYNMKSTFEHNSVDHKKSIYFIMAFKTTTTSFHDVSQMGQSTIFKLYIHDNMTLLGYSRYRSQNAWIK